MERKRTKLQEQTAEYLSKYPHLQSSPNVTARPGKPSLQRSLKASNNPNAAAERKSKSKIPISTSGIFKKPIQPPAALKTKLNPPKRIQAPTSTSGTSSSTSKPRVTIVSPNKISKPQRKEHVLSRNFKGKKSISLHQPPGTHIQQSNDGTH
ncbi:hypothetical protein M501DRAFT_1001711 [Patellaria atrata CBS 101060]|uniref:Uncharacterized protein n=1 Tax=Patellaria atrata CBS 101060 TaxID=1346257 RepID=A0A9P4VT98_9PEZI|nr:hypothetical protein M501DRAFT_1001711 [Patellaria atrata CBS 101060]